MKEIFDWLREQIEEKSVEVNNVAVVSLHNAIVSVNRAELKWEKDCCEWKYEKNMPSFARATHDVPKLVDEIRYWTFCPYCGKRIKIVEVE